MSDSTTDPVAIPAGTGLVSRILGIIFSPRETFAVVAAHPRWLGMLAVVTLVTALSTTWFLSTEVGRQAMLDQQVSTMESFGVEVTDQQYEAMQQRLGISSYIAAVQILIFVPVITAAVAGVLMAVFTVALGGGATFKQIFAVVTHVGAISLVQQIFVTPLNYIRGSMSSPTNLSVFFPMLAEDTFTARLLGSVDLFLVWWTAVLAIGLAVLYRRKTRPIAVALFAVYGLIAVAIAVIKTALGGS